MCAGKRHSHSNDEHGRNLLDGKHHFHLPAADTVGARAPALVCNTPAETLSQCHAEHEATDLLSVSRRTSRYFAFAQHDIHGDLCQCHTVSVARHTLPAK